MKIMIKQMHQIKDLFQKSLQHNLHFISHNTAYFKDPEDMWARRESLGDSVIIEGSFSVNSTQDKVEYNASYTPVGQADGDNQEVPIILMFVISNNNPTIEMSPPGDNDKWTIAANGDLQLPEGETHNIKFTSNDVDGNSVQLYLEHTPDTNFDAGAPSVTLTQDGHSVDIVVNHLQAGYTGSFKMIAKDSQVIRNKEGSAENFEKFRNYKCESDSKKFSFRCSIYRNSKWYRICYNERK